MKTVFPLLLILLLAAAPVAAQENKPWMGVALEVLDAEEAAKMGLPGGLKVNRVDEGSPAETAGLVVGDVVVSAGEHAVTTIEKMAEIMGELRPGDLLTLGACREGGRIELLLVTLGSVEDKDSRYADDERASDLLRRLRELDAQRRQLYEQLQERLRELRANEPAEAAAEELPAVPAPQAEPTERTEIRVTLKATLRDLTVSEAADLGLRGGVMTVRVAEGGPAYLGGLKSGDVLTHVDDEQLAGTGDLRKILSRHEPANRVELRIQRDGNELRVTVELGAR